MTVYVVLVFLSVLCGMAVSVKAFGTGGKRSKVFEDIYFSVEDVDGLKRLRVQCFVLKSIFV